MKSGDWLVGQGLLPSVLGFTDGILTAITLAAGRLINPEQHMPIGLALRIATGALASGAFVFFVAQYAHLRRELIRAERQLNLLSHGRLASSKLGAAVLREGLLASAISSFAAFCGALVPLVAAALFPKYRGGSIVVALVALALLGTLLARVLHGGAIRWSVGLVLGGVVLSTIGALLKITG
jgi:predicted membrane protein (TIGR00267 family)